MLENNFCLAGWNCDWKSYILQRKCFSSVDVLAPMFFICEWLILSNHCFNVSWVNSKSCYNWDGRPLTQGAHQQRRCKECRFVPLEIPAVPGCCIVSTPGPAQQLASHHAPCVTNVAVSTLRSKPMRALPATITTVHAGAVWTKQQHNHFDRTLELVNQFI